MKTGWQMEWEHEVRYFAPLRAEFNTRAKAMAAAMEPMRKAVQQFGKPMREATQAFQKMQAALLTWEKR